MKYLKMGLVGLIACLAVCASDGERTPRFLAHLLGYIALDYSGAVSDEGKEISPAEYAEMKEFAATVVQVNSALSETKGFPDLHGELTRLQTLIAGTAPPKEVVRLAGDCRDKVIRITGLPVAPHQWPNQANAKHTFDRNCAQCHGASGHGDGPSGTQLDPRPTNFYADKMDGISPFQAFNAIRLGVPGTAMMSFTQFSDGEVWELAFYVLSLRHRAVAELTPPLVSPFDLVAVSVNSDEGLRALVAGGEAEKRAAVTKARLFTEENAIPSSLNLARQKLQESLNFYSAGQIEKAKTAAVVAYLDGVEPAEPRLRARDLSFTTNLEVKMAAVRGAIDGKLDAKIWAERVATADQALVEAAALIAKKESSAAFTFSVAAGIVLREAFEAVLIIITLLGVIKAVGAKRAALVVHAGWLLAVATGIVAWLFSGWVVQLSGAHRELLEGTISLLAFVVLLYLGFWLHRKSEIGRWRAFIDEIVKTAVDNKRLAILGGVAFMAVFREAFETVLFLRALLLEAGPGQEPALLLGVVTSLIVVIALSTAVVRYSVKIPIRQLFALSSMTMVLLAMILVGQAMHSFQEAGKISVTEIPLAPRLDLFGIYPTYETMIPQVLIFSACLSFWLYGKFSEQLRNRMV